MRLQPCLAGAELAACSILIGASIFDVAQSERRIGWIQRKITKVTAKLDGVIEWWASLAVPAVADETNPLPRLPASNAAQTARRLASIP